MSDAVPTLVEPDWLADRLEEPGLRILDCTAHLHFHPETGARRTDSGRPGWERAHVPGSVHVDVPTTLSVTEEPAYPYQAPTAEAFATAMERLGVGDDSRVVLYDAAGGGWAARVWWLLRAFGFDRAGVLNGGWVGWIEGGRPISTAASGSEPPTDGPESAVDGSESGADVSGSVTHGSGSGADVSESASGGTPTTFTPDPRPGLFADRAEVRASIDDPDRLLLNALRPEDFAGTGLVKYGRPGRIPASVNLPAVGENAIVDPESHRYLPVPELHRRFADVGAFDCDRLITYCGGAIAASKAALAATLVGIDDVAVYDGSLAEWGESALPMETD